MTVCPKCGGAVIRGPRYSKTVFGSECLRYECFTCGYETTTPTKDNQRRDLDALLASLSRRER